MLERTGRGHKSVWSNSMLFRKTGDQLRSKVTKEKLTKLRYKYRIPDIVELSVPKKDDRPCKVKDSKVAMYKAVYI